jgi:serine/threonine protein kinase
MAFQDATSFYIMMDYVPGGDLVTHLQTLDTFNKEEARFYTAELVEAVDYIHTTLGYMHRDIKPDNVVLDERGHVRIVDFGGCMSLKHSECWLEPSFNVWGTPPFMAPEMHRGERYGKESDFWSIGVIFYEMIFGGPPFVDDEGSVMVTAARVAQWKQHLVIPYCPWVGENEVNLVERLICDARDRLTAAGVRSHCFFRGLDFARLGEMDPPIRPAAKVRHDSDTELMLTTQSSRTSTSTTDTGLPSAPEPPFLAEVPDTKLFAPSPKRRTRWTMLYAIANICST